MAKVTVTRTIQAPQERVFQAVAEPEVLTDVIPDVLRVTFHTESRSGVGARFTETRRVGKKEMDTDLEITEHEPHTHARMVADSHGTIWDTTFTVKPAGEAVKLDIAMDARPHKLLPKIMTPLFKGLFKKGLEKHIDHVKAWCESTT